MFDCQTAIIMKCPRYEAAMAHGVEKSSAAAEARVLHLKASPLKEPPNIKPQCPPAGSTTVLFTSTSTSRAVHDKENSTGREHDRFEDSGYLSLQSSQIEEHHREEEEEEEEHKRGKPARQDKTTSPKSSPSKCPERTDSRTPVDRHKRRTAAFSLSSTPSDRHRDPNLPILNFQRAVCEELAKSYQKNKRYDWSVVTKVAEDHLLDRVIGGQMGREYVDVFSCLLSRNMRTILTHILSLLGDLDLISCKTVSRTWRRIISDDSAARSRCRRAEQTLRESSSSLRQSGCGLTRDVSVSRVVLSCMQTLASSSTPSSSSSSSSTPSCRLIRRTSVCQRSGTPPPPCTRFTEYLQAASALKQHESLRSCRHCGSPATHSSEVQRATCTRAGCLFEFCTRCQEAFHGSAPCRVVRPRAHTPALKTTPVVPGGARSKRNIRRL
ncbi:F-box only protein 5 [Cebidichthys violaceus]|uniref:F-box only protein 5 n=1 Tax=Cebidichthys violaceus TaxID=271503 RepID=UPI0035CB2E63